MRQAGKNALIGFIAVTAIVASLQPWEAVLASQSRSNRDQQGQSSAMAEISSASLTPISSLIPTPKLATFTDQHLLLESMQLPAEPTQDTTLYASANTPKVEGVVVTDTTAPATAAVETTPETAIEEHHIDSTDYALNADVLFELVNQHRASIGKPALQKDDRLMQIGQSRAPEVFDEIFVTGNMHAGFYARNLPYWATETIIHYHNEEGALNWWLHSPVHRPILEGDYLYAGIGCSGKDCSMIFSNFVAK